MFFNEAKYKADIRLLQRLKNEVSASHTKTHQRINSFDDIKNFKISQYIGAKFLEYGFDYPTTDTRILRIEGEERALQTLNQYGGKSLQEAYFNKFLREYDKSQTKVIEENSLENELFESKNDKEKAFNEIIKKQMGNFNQNYFVGNQGKNPLWTFPHVQTQTRERKDGKRISLGEDSHDSDSSGDGNDDDFTDGLKSNSRAKRTKKFLRKEFKKYLIFTGKMDGKNNMISSGDHRVSIDTPKQAFERDAYKKRPMFLDPLNGEYKLGYNNIDSTFIRRQMNDSEKNSLATTDVDTLRAGTNKNILRNDRSVRKKVFDFIDQKEKKLESFSVDQHGNFISLSESNESSDQFASEQYKEKTLGHVLETGEGSPNLTLDEDNYDWDQFTAIYNEGEDADLNDPRTGTGLILGEEKDKASKLSEKDKDDEVNLSLSYNRGDDDDDNNQGGNTLLTGQNSLAIRVGGMGQIINMMDSEGYDENQINEFLENMSINRDEFNGLPIDLKINEITKTLNDIDSLNGIDPLNSLVSAEDKEKVYRERRLRKAISKPSNLISKVFSKDKSLDTLNGLSTKLHETSHIKPTDPGQPEDPYQAILEEIPESEEANVNQERQEYFKSFDEKLNLFTGITPLEQENAVGMNQFLRQVVQEDPLEIEREKLRKNEEQKLRENLLKNYNPNNVPTKGASRYDKIEMNGSYKNGTEEKFEREIILDEEDIESQRNVASDDLGRPSVAKAVKNAISDVIQKEQSTLGGILGNSNGTTSFKDFTSDDYFRLVGVESEEQFQSMLDEKMNARSRSGDNLVTGSSKLNFLPGEKRPNLNFPPLSLLPTDNEHKVIGAKPLFGGGLFLDETLSGKGDVPSAEMMSMEIDENLANTCEQSIITDTTVNEVNVVSDDHKETNYAVRIRSLESVKERSIYIVQMLLKDALETGRIDQTMLQNLEVIKICQILTHVVGVLLSRQSRYFENFHYRQLELINVETIVDSSYGYFTLLHNGEYLCSLLEISRNVFNFKMEPVTEIQFRSSANEETPRIRIFKEFLYYVLRENQIEDPDSLIVFRSETRFRQSTIIRYQSLDPQMKTKHFFLLLENYLLQLHISGNTSISDPFKFNNILESDLHRRFNAVLMNYIAGVNATMEQLLARSPFALLFTESDQRMNNRRCLSYRRALLPIINNMFSASSNAESDFNGEGNTWSLLFHSKDAEQFKRRLEIDLPPNANTIKYILDSYRERSFFTASEGLGGNQWAQLEPTKLIDVLINSFIEHQVIPPIDGNYKREMSNFFSVLMADPIHQMFVKHLKPLYRRGWRKQNLARQAAFALVEHYVCLILMIVQRALLQNNGHLSTTAIFMSDIDGFTPMVKLADVLRELIMAFDPLAYIMEEVGNRENHEEKFKHHFKMYTNYVGEIMRSYELWLQDKVDAYSLGPQSEMSREDLFYRIISAGGYEESKDKFLEGISTKIAESDEITIENQPAITVSDQSPRVDESGMPMKHVNITIKNTGSQTMPVPKANATDPITVKLEPHSDKTSVNIDASHPQVRGMNNADLMNSIRKILREELALNIRQVAVPLENSELNSSTDTRSYVGYATVEKNSELSESVLGTESLADQETLLYNFSIKPSDSASQVGTVSTPTGAAGDIASTINYYAPSQLEEPDLSAPGQVILTTNNAKDENLHKVDPAKTPAILTISEPVVITATGDNVSTVLPDNTVTETVTKEIDLSESNNLLSDDLTQRLELLQDPDEEFFADELTLLSYAGGGQSDFESETDDNPEILANTNRKSFNEPNETVPILIKDKFSATKLIDESRNQIDEVIKRIGAYANTEINGKMKRAKSRVMPSRAAKSRQQSNFLEQEEKSLLKKIQMPSKVAKKLEKENMKKQNKTKRDVVNVSKPVSLRKVKKNKHSSVVLAPPTKKPKIKPIERTNSEKYMRDIGRRLERMKRNQPERLVSKPLPKHPPYLKTFGEKSTYIAAAKNKPTKGKKRKTFEKNSSDEEYDDTPTSNIDERKLTRGKRHKR